MGLKALLMFHIVREVNADGGADRADDYDDNNQVDDGRSEGV